jgi:pimeloyl-ACP methyl ester carboxylesterase|tara:strand:- start:365 stop:1246 length:882 start_codon:yes stop_codon:yes gene_type:complete
MERKTFTNSSGENFSFLEKKSENSNINLVFFHATGFNAKTYQILFDKLSQCFGNEISIYALDQRGHGLSTAKADPDELKSWQTFVEDGNEFLKSIKGSIVCSGHSMGSIIAAKIASMHPDKVSHLYMIEPVLYGPLESLKFRFMSFIKYNRGLSIADGAAKRRREFPAIEDALTSYTGRGAFTTWDKEWIEDYLEGGTLETSSGVELSCSPEWEAATFRSSSMDTWRYLKKVKIDVMVVYGKFGSTFSAQARRVLFQLGHNWHSKYYEKASHFLPMEFSDSIVEDLQSYLKRI